MTEITHRSPGDTAIITMYVPADGLILANQHMRFYAPPGTVWEMHVRYGTQQEHHFFGGRIDDLRPAPETVALTNDEEATFQRLVNPPSSWLHRLARRLWG